VNEAAANEAAVTEAVPASILDAQVNALLGLVSQRREQRTRDIRAQSDAQVEEILRAARAEARESLHQAVARERARLSQGLRQAQARAELETRQRAQRETLTLLQHMWPRIGATLEARWREEQERGVWIAAAMQDAAQLLGGRPWRIEHAAGLTPEERQRALTQAGAGGAQDVEWHPEPQLTAGLRVRTTGACLDATIEGLLVDREDVEALFLSEYLALGPKP
jgi:hypothetical protein